MPEDDGTQQGGGDAWTPPASQANLDKIIEQRLARERSKYTDYDDLKAKAAKLDEAEDASKSDLQKAQEELAARDAALKDLPAQVRQQAIKFASEASKLGFLDPEDTLRFIDVDLGDEAAVKAALTELAENKPYLVRQDEAKTTKPKTRPKPVAGAAADGSDDKELEGKARAAQALRDFRKT